jgi:monoamine oxidase
MSTGFAQALAGQLQLGMRLVRVRKTSAGRIELTFKNGAKTVVKTHDAVVLATPFTALRDVDLDASLGLPP